MPTQPLSFGVLEACDQSLGVVQRFAKCVEAVWDSLTDEVRLALRDHWGPVDGKAAVLLREEVDLQRMVLLQQTPLLELARNLFSRSMISFDRGGGRYLGWNSQVVELLDDDLLATFVGENFAAVYAKTPQASIDDDEQYAVMARELFHADLQAMQHWMSEHAADLERILAEQGAVLDRWEE